MTPHDIHDLDDLSADLDLQPTSPLPARHGDGPVEVQPKDDMFAADSETARALAEIEYPHDGPVTAFVALIRATRLAASSKYSPEVLANAVYQALGLGAEDK